MFKNERSFRRLTWDTIGRERAGAKVTKFYKRYDFDMEARHGLAEQIIADQFARVGRYEL